MKANETPETYPIQFRDKIDEYLWKEHHILGGCCSSIEEMKYSVAREVVEKLTEAFLIKALAYLNSKFYFHNAFYGVVSTDFNAIEELCEDFEKYMKGE